MFFLIYSALAVHYLYCEIKLLKYKHYRPIGTMGMCIQMFTDSQSRHLEEVGWLAVSYTVFTFGKVPGFILKESILVVQRLSYSLLDLGFAGSIPVGVDGSFQTVKILSMTSFGREVKPWVPCRRFTASKRTSSRN